MTARHLTRRDPARNMARFYRLDVQPDLFGGWMLVREWGRIGRPGRTNSTAYINIDEAAASLNHQQTVKERRGYQPSLPPGDNDAAYLSR